MTFLYVIAMLLLIASVSSFSFAPSRNLAPSFRSTRIHCLSSEEIQKLDEMKSRFSLATVEGEEAAKMGDLMEKYETLKEIKNMMKKLRSMWVNEASEKRKERQLKSFVDLYQGKLDLEAIIKEKLGMPSAKKSVDMSEIEKWDKEISTLKAKLESATVVVPSGSRSIDERFSY